MLILSFSQIESVARQALPSQIVLVIKS